MPSGVTPLCQVFIRRWRGPLERSNSSDPCCHDCRKRDVVEVPNEGVNDAEADIELVLTTSGSLGGQYEGHTVHQVKSRGETPVKPSSHTSDRVTPAETVQRGQRTQFSWNDTPTRIQVRRHTSYQVSSNKVNRPQSPSSHHQGPNCSTSLFCQ